jgi:hypothetical protein
MDFYECVPVLNRYRRTFVEQDGVALYFYQTNLSTPNLRPSTEYLGYIVEGLNSHSNVSADYCKEVAATATTEPDNLVTSYPWRQPGDRAGWIGITNGSYQKFVQMIFLMFLYKYSLTDHFIRR